MPPALLARSLDVEIAPTATGLEFRRRPQGSLVVGGVLGLAAAGLYILGSVLRTAHSSLLPNASAMGLLFVAVGVFTGAMAALLLLGALGIVLSPSWRVFAELSRESRTLRWRRKTFALSDLSPFRLEPFGTRMVSAVLSTRSGEAHPIWTVPLRRRAEADQLAAALNEILGGAAASDQPTPPTTGQVAARFEAYVLLGIGAVWTLGGFLFLRSLVFSDWLDPGTHIPVWVVGLLPLGIGAWMLRPTKR